MQSDMNFHPLLEGRNGTGPLENYLEATYKVKYSFLGVYSRERKTGCLKRLISEYL